MNIAECALVLAKAAAFDRRTVGDADVMAWYEAIGDLDASEALAAVTRWYRDRSDWLMPSHLREVVRQLQVEGRRAARLAKAEAAVASGTEQVRRSWGELDDAERERLRTLSAGVLERWPTYEEARSERFDAPRAE